MPEKIVQSERLVGAASEKRTTVSMPCRSRVGDAKKKKKDTTRTPKSNESYRYRCPTRGVSVQPSL